MKTIHVVTDLDKLVNETLMKMPLNERLKMINGAHEEHKFKIEVLGMFGAYQTEAEGLTNKVKLLGPYNSVPSFIVASNDEGKKDAINKYCNDFFGIGQRQLIVLEKGIFYRQIGTDTKGLLIGTLENISLANGYTKFRNTEKRQRRYDEKEVGAIVVEEDRTRYSEELASPRIWNHIVKDMVKYALEYGCSNIIYGTERCRDKVVETLGELKYIPLHNK